MDSEDQPTDGDTDRTTDDSSETPTDEDRSRPSSYGDQISRRSTLAALLGVGGLGLVGSDVASAQPARPWQQDVDANGYRLIDLGSLAMTANSTAITDFEGTNLSIDGNGVLNATDTNTDTRTDVSDDGSQVVTDTEDINFATNLSVSDDGDGSVTVDASGASPWEDTDSDGLLEAPAFDGIDIDFVKTPQFGTTDTTALEGVVNDERFLRVEPTASNEASNIVAGHLSNRITSGIVGATIAGGGQDTARNTVGGNYGTVSGGAANRATGTRSAVGGGRDNDATGNVSTVGGGDSNDATGTRSAVGGGTANDAAGNASTVGGGSNNDATGNASTVPGGADNDASGDYSFAAGRRAKTETGGPTPDPHDGAVVFGDSSNTTFRSQGDDEFRSQMPMYAPSFNTTSARAKKQAIEPVDPGTVLDTVTALEVSTWEFKHNGDGRHMGPMAGEFADAFELGDDDDHIATVDADGVALAAIQGLSEKLAEKDKRIEEVEAENERKDERLDDLKGEVDQKAERINELQDRLTTIEAQIGTTETPADD